MPEWLRQVELTKAGPGCAEFVLDHVLVESLKILRARQLESFNDAYGVLHSIECGAMTTASIYQIWDKDEDPYEFGKDDFVEPTPAKIDSLSDPKSKNY